MADKDKDCADCDYSTETRFLGWDDIWCHHPKALVFDGVKECADRTYKQRKGGFFACRLKCMCGEEGRWFKKKEKD